MNLYFGFPFHFLSQFFHFFPFLLFKQYLSNLNFCGFYYFNFVYLCTVTFHLAEADNYNYNWLYSVQNSERIAAVQCSPIGPRLGGVGLVKILTGKLGRAWVGAWVGAWHGAWVVGLVMLRQCGGWGGGIHGYTTVIVL